MFGRFWWGHHDKKKKAHWIKWRVEVASVPNSLVSRVFKAKYYPRGDFLEAGVGRRPSYAWRSITSARSVLSLGMRWHIGNGNSVRITEDKWLPFSLAKTPFSVCHILDKKERVSMLIKEDSNTWDVDRVGALFSPWEAKVICNIPLPPSRKGDRLFWNESNSGLFTVKSAYYLQRNRELVDVVGECSQMDRERNFWKFLWSLSLPPKIKAFLWRACTGILPTNGLLWSRHMRRDGLCECCKQEVESDGHALWSCMVANDVWLESKLSVHKWDRFVNCFFDLMVYARCRLNVEEMRLFCCLAYFIWGQRNLMVHEGRGVNPVAVVHRARRMLADYQKAWHGLVGEVSRERQVLREEIIDAGWIPPGEGL
uniref:Reverse transcriptase zinc-binding domain-containing protein n=1 Tax=Fagus sylvatica TaxID=28930 RepID=A0A2N9EDK8_FAGSY